MTNNDFESRLSDLLEQQANSIEVQPDLDSVVTPSLRLTTDSSVARTSSIARSARGTWLLAAAALLIVAVLGGAALLDRTGDTTDPVPDNELAAPGGLSPEVLAEMMDSVGPTVAGEVIIWIEPDASAADIEAIGDWLDSRAVAQGWSYVDADATWTEFQEYWPESPEVLDAVTPEQLPTSFRVFTNDPETLTRILGRTGLASIRQIDPPDEDELAVSTVDALYLLPSDQPLPESVVRSVESPADGFYPSELIVTVGRATDLGFDQISRITLVRDWGETPPEYEPVTIHGRVIESPPDNPRFATEQTDDGTLLYESSQPLSPELIRAITVIDGQIQLTGSPGNTRELSRRSALGGYRAQIRLATADGAGLLEAFQNSVVPTFSYGLPPRVMEDWPPAFILETRVADSADELFDGWGGVLEHVAVGDDPGFLARVEVPTGDGVESLTQLRWFRASTDYGPSHIVTVSVAGLSDAELVDYALSLESVDALTWNAAVAATATSD